MQNIIDLLTPKERALLFTAIKNLKEGAESGLATAIMHSDKNMLQQFFSDTRSNCDALTKKLFAECFIEDLDYCDQYAKENKLSALNPIAKPFGG